MTILQASSLRHAGIEDTNEESLSFYSEYFFEGYEYITMEDDTDLPDYLNNNDISYVIIGESEWTLYT